MSTIADDFKLGRVHFVGGPAHGQFTLERPKPSTMIIPAQDLSQFRYTLRRCRDSAGEIIEVLAPAGQEIDRKWLAANGLRN